jgi:hypothetical protein
MMSNYASASIGDINHLHSIDEEEGPPSVAFDLYLMQNPPTRK